MEKNVYVWPAALIALVILAVVGFAIFRHPNAQIPSSLVPTSTITSNGTTTTVTSSSGASITAQGGTITITKISPPSLTDPIIISNSMPQEAQALLRSQEQTLITELKQTPLRADLWLQLGVDRKIGSDYEGAIAAWSYVAAAGPDTINYVAYGNLGDLYMNFQVDYPKAESNYKKAIAIKPTVIDYYRSLFILYSGFYKTNTSAAADIVAQGLKANPNNPDLLQLQAQLNAKKQ